MSTGDESALASLVYRCLEGDNAAWKELLEIVTPRILALCRQYHLSQEEALDIYGQVCFRLLNDLEKVESPEKLVAYVGRVARNMAHNYYLELRKTVRLDESMDGGSGFHSDAEAQEKLEQTERMAVLMEAMAELPAKQYQVLKMLLLDEDEPSYRQVAERLEMPISSVGPTRTRALENLKAKLAQKKFKF